MPSLGLVSKLRSEYADKLNRSLPGLRFFGESNPSWESKPSTVDGNAPIPAATADIIAVRRTNSRRLFKVELGVLELGVAYT
jgi:hypothetical protein